MKTLIALFPIIILVFLACFFATPDAGNDGYTYYALTRSLVRDSDFDISHDSIVTAPGRLRLSTYPDMDSPRPIFSGGYALSYFLFLKYLPQIQYFQIPAVNLSEYRSEIPRTDALAILAGSLCFGLGTLLLMGNILSRRFSSLTVNWTLLLTFAGTPLIYYTLSEPGFSHAVDAFAFTLCVWAIDKCRFSGNFFYLLLAGVAAGWSFSIRNINAAPLAILMLSALSTGTPENREIPKRRFTRLLLLVIGAAPFVLFQLYYNQIQYGNWMTFGYAPSGALHFESHLIEMLFSKVRGLFTWTPLTAVAAAGWVVLYIKDRWLTLVCFFTTAAFFTAAQFFPHWWGGTAFGLRFATHLAVFFAVGTAALMAKKKLFIPVVITCSAYTLFIFMMFVTVQHSPEGLRCIQDTGSQYTPKDIAACFNQRYSIYKTANPLSFFWDEMTRGHIPAVIPNLLKCRQTTGTIFVTGLKASVNHQAFASLEGTLKTVATSNTAGTFTFAVWPYLDPGDHYSENGKNGAFEVLLYFKKGQNTVKWYYDLQNRMRLIPPGQRDPIKVPRVLNRSQGQLLKNLHISVGVFSEASPRVMDLDVKL